MSASEDSHRALNFLAKAYRQINRSIQSGNQGEQILEHLRLLEKVHQKLDEGDAASCDERYSTDMRDEIAHVAYKEAFAIIVSLPRD